MKNLQQRNSSNTPERGVAKPKAQSLFATKVYAVVAKIPKGKTMTYKQVATKAGNPSAARAVGMLMSKNYRSEIPCHRVVRTDGKMGGYNRGGATRKAQILAEERR